MEDILIKPSIDTDSYSNHQIGKYVKTGFENISPKSLVLITVDEFRNHKEIEGSSFQRFRSSLYEMMAGNWKLPIIDLGTLRSGNLLKDTFYALSEIGKKVVEAQAIPIVIGGSQVLSYALYNSLAYTNKPLNYTAVDYKLPLQVAPKEEVTEDNILNHLITDERHLLFQFANLGYQSFYTSYQIIDTLHSLDYEAYRLGEITQDLKESEPVFRSSDLVTFNMDALESLQHGDRLHPNPNGFNSREICALSKFAALSPQLKTIGFFNYFENTQNQIFSKLLAQIIWYFIEGKNISLGIENTHKKYKKYRVMHEDKTITFYQDEIINKWWIALEDSTKGEETLVPCSQRDYESAKNNEIPDRYWKNLKRFL